jgi:hypothetical protein
MRYLTDDALHLVTPYKRKRNEEETAVPTLFNRFVSSIRQPIESLFGWLIQRTDLQNASHVRSTLRGSLVEGLIRIFHPSITRRAKTTVIHIAFSCPVILSINGLLATWLAARHLAYSILRGKLS